MINLDRSDSSDDEHDPPMQATSPHQKLRAGDPTLQAANALAMSLLRKDPSPTRMNTPGNPEFRGSVLTNSHASSTVRGSMFANGPGGSAFRGSMMNGLGGLRGSLFTSGPGGPALRGSLYPNGPGGSAFRGSMAHAPSNPEFRGSVIENFRTTWKSESSINSFVIKTNNDAQMLIDIIQKPHKKQSELLTLANFFQNIPFIAKTIQKLPPYSFISLIKKIRYESLQEHKILFRKNEYGDKYYILLHGRLAMLGDKPTMIMDSSKNDLNNTATKSNIDEDRPPPSPEKKRIFKDSKRPSFVNSNSSIVRSPKGRGRKREAALTTHPHFEFSPIGGTPKSYYIGRPGTTVVSAANSPKAGGRYGNTPKAEQRLSVSSFMAGAGNKISTFAKSHYTQSPKNGNRKLVVNVSHDHSHDDKGDSVLQVSPFSIKNDSLIEREEDAMSCNSDQQFEDFLECHFPGEKMSKDVKPGTGFGEQALTGNPKRNVTMISMRDCHFAVLDKMIYDEVFKEFQEGLYKQNLTFLQSIHVFQDWSDAKLTALLMIFDNHNYVRNNAVYSAGETAGHIYFVKSGEIELVEMINLAKKDEKKDKDPNSYVKDLDNLNIKKRNQNKHQLRKVIAKIGPGSVFGEEEIFEQVKRRYTAVVASHHAEVLAVTKRKFFDNFRGTIAHHRLLEQYEAQQAWRKDFKDQIRDSIVKREEDKLKVPYKPVKTEEDLNTQHKLINSRLVILSPNCSRLLTESVATPEPVELSLGEPNIMARSGVNELREEPKGENKKNINNSRADITSTGLKKTMKSLGNIIGDIKSPKNINTVQSEDRRLQTSITKRGQQTLLTEGNVDNTSPRVAIKPALPYYDFEKESPLPEGPGSPKSAVIIGQWSPKKRNETIDEIRLFGEASSPHKLRGHSRSHSKGTQSSDISKNWSISKIRLSIQTKASTFGDNATDASKFVLKAFPTRTNSKSFAMEDNKSPEKTMDLSNADFDKIRPSTAVRPGTGMRPATAMNASVSIFPMQGQSPWGVTSPKLSMRSDCYSPKEFVNIHVQKMVAEKQKPKIHGVFMLPNGKTPRRPVA